MKQMMTLLTWAACVALVCADSEPTTANWAIANTAKLAQENQGEAPYATFNKGGLPALFAKVKAKGETDPFAAVHITKLTQMVLLPQNGAYRLPYADALLLAAQQAKDPEVVCFFLNQLRWCGCAQHCRGVSQFLASADKGVADFAAMVVTALRDEGVGIACKPIQVAPASPEETAKAIAALKDAKDAEGKIRLLDKLGVSKDKAAISAVAALLNDAEPEVSDAAFLALAKLSPDAVADSIPAVLQTADPAHKAVIDTALRQLPTKALAQKLKDAYPKASETGKSIALDLLQMRRVADALPLAVQAIDSGNADVQLSGYRLLRDQAGKAEAANLFAHVLKAKGRAQQEAENALVAVAKRDGGETVKRLGEAIRGTDATNREIALSAAARVGGAELLQAAAAAAGHADATAAATAARALMNWEGAEAIPALLEIAATSKIDRCRKLALNGIKKKLDPSNKSQYVGVWRNVRAKAEDEAIRKEIDELFVETVNVVKGKPVTTNVATEGGNVPANLVDGTLQKGWHGHGIPGIATIDIGSVQPVFAANVAFYADGRRAYTFKLEISVDGKEWKQVATNEGKVKVSRKEGFRFDFGGDFPARYVRLTVLKNTANPFTHVQELEVYSRTTL